MELNGKITKIYKQSSNWICVRFCDDSSKQSYIAKGNVSGMFLPEMKVSIVGDFVDDPKYGRQIEIREMETRDSVTVAYLSKCVKGVGTSLAKQIVKTLGEDCISKILEDENILLTVKGIKKKKFKQIVTSLHAKNNIALYLSILEFFKNDITQNQVDKIVDCCEQKKTSWSKIKKNPYWLISHIDGFGFKKVDKLALSSGLGEYSTERIEAAIVYSLQQLSQKSGHCYADMGTLSREVADLILGAPTCINKRSFNRLLEYLDLGDNEATEDLILKNDKNKELRTWVNNYDKIIDIMCVALDNNEREELIVIEDEKIYWKDLYDAEVNCAKIISNLAWKTPTKKIGVRQIKAAIKEIEDFEGCTFSDEQKQAVENSLGRRLAVITGGPGRGKTTILKAIIRAWNDDDNVVLLAPTGRAAKRMTEASGYKASTIHRFNIAIKQSGEKPERKLIVVDETSMIGTKLASVLLSNVKNCNIIFVGDIDQLASIEPGCFMKDIISCGQVMVSYLTKGFRNGGSIARNADLINKGKHMKEFIFDADTKFIEKYGEDVTTAAVEFYENALKRFKPNEIGILTPLRSRGSGSVDSINNLIRNKLNPITEKNIENKTGFLINDRVMNTKNNYDKDILNEYYVMEKGIFNGDTGTIVNIDYDDEEVEILFDDGRRGYFRYDEMSAFVLAYATTIHKSQGSEYKCVLVIVSSQSAFFLKRNLVYTGFTRAKQQLTILGDEKAIAIAARNIDDSVRNSHLKYRIISMIKKRK